MLTLLDDYAIHQTPEPVARPATSDRNFYDRWFFAGHSADGRIAFEAALGLYPHRQVLDAHFTLLEGGVQHCFHGSRRAPFERTETAVGPLRLTIEQPMRVLRLELDDAASGLACDLRFTARSSPAEEPRSVLHDGERLVMHTTRFTQFGRWSGWVAVDGRRVDIGGLRGLGGLPGVDGLPGVRDRSWGIRPCGEPEGGAPPPTPRAPTVYWAWVPLGFDDLCTQFNTFEDPTGRPTQLAAHLQPAYADPAAVPAVADPGQREVAEAQLVVRWKPGTRWPDGGTLTMAGADGAAWRIALEPLATLLAKGLGYHHPEWGHGFWKGELALGHERFRPDELDPLRPENVHVHQIVRARLIGPEGSGRERLGVGILETLCFGPHAPSGFAGFLDGAPAGDPR
jgi:hypothetical protein